MAQFQQMMNLIIGRALEVNNEKLSQDISCLVKQRLAGELELLLKDSNQKEEERFRLLDETIRSFQKSGQEKLLQRKCHFLSENALDVVRRSFFTGKREVKKIRKFKTKKEDKPGALSLDDSIRFVLF